MNYDNAFFLNSHTGTLSIEYVTKSIEACYNIMRERERAVESEREIYSMVMRTDS